ncbi:neuronal acetylcholine receptor subunit alpha-4-like [Bicyclus anynana]|uniref:Neuronal acetylcholine receptor subunit alpha-4-like n=1 Tax=Bicyclus anynana TaxID=110368 RepID=A0A6J1N900_BICAN|nr:neuronal acetylcholine receptor subunit alpha-4-like [Bicyclus anynana]
MVTKMLVIIALMFINLPLNNAIDNDAKTYVHMEQKLHSDLFKGYAKYKSPSTNVTTIKLRFILRYFWFDENEEEFFIHTWAYLSWKDPRLTWKPEDYENIQQTLVRSMSIWGPPYLFSNVKYSFDEFGVEQLSSWRCTLRNSGSVRAVIQLTLRTSCKSKINNWPYDIQYCSFKFVPNPFKRLLSGQSTRYRDKVLYDYPSKHGLAVLLELSYASGWDILDYNTSYERTNTSMYYLEFNFLVERQASSYATIVIVPAIALAVFTLCSMFLDVRHNVRILIACFSFLSHVSLLEILSFFVPRKAVESPLILSFICSSIIITACIIFLTIALNSVLRMKISPTSKIVGFNEQILGTALKYFIFPKWEVDLNVGTDDLNSLAKTRITFVSIVNSLFIYLFTFVYLILYCIYMPRPTSNLVL